MVLVLGILGALVFWALRALAQTDVQFIPWQSLFLPLLANVGFLGFAAWRMQTLSATPLRFVTSVKSIALVSTLLIAFPSRLSDLIKPVYLLERDKLPMAQGFSVLFLERALDMLMVAGLLGVIVLGLDGSGGQDFASSARVLVVICAVLGALFAALLLAPDMLRKMINWLPFAPLRAFAEQFLDALIQAGKTGRLWAGTALSVAVWLCAYLIFYFYLSALTSLEGDVNITAMAALVVFAAGTIGLIATVTPGGVGTYEFAIALALSSYGVPLAEGLVHGLALRIIVLLPNLVVVGQMLVFDKFKIKELRARVNASRREP